MAAPATVAIFLKPLLKAGGAIDQFHLNHNIDSVVVDGYFFSKPAISNLLRYLLPQYRSFKDNDRLIDELYDNKLRDPNVRRLASTEEPIFSREVQEEFDKVQNLPPEQQPANQQKVIEKIIGTPPKPVEQVALKIQEEEKKEEGGPPQIPRTARIPTGPSIPETPPVSPPRVGGVLRGIGSRLSKGAGGMLRAGGSLGGRLGGLAAQGVTRGLALLGGAVVSAVGWPVIIAVLVVIIAIPVLVLIINLLGTSTQCPPYQPNCGAPQVISASELPPPSSIDPDTPYVPRGGAGLISCPVNSGIITNGSKERGGHCSPGYEAQYGVCARPGEGNYRGKETAIDVISFDKVVYVPFLTGGANPQLWKVDEVGTPIAEFEGGGIAVGISTEAAGHTFRARFVHLSSTTLGINQKVQPGTIIGQYNLSAKHVHVTLQEDGVFKPADLYFNLCQ